jgi:prevent-host-death family protein
MVKSLEGAMNWKIAEAKQKFSELLRAAEEEPQWIYNRERLVAAVVPAETLQEFLEWRTRRERPSLADAFEELRRILRDEDYALEIPERRDRPNPFAGGGDDVSL